MSLLFLFISYNFLVILMKEKIKTVLSGTAVLVLTAILIIYSSRAKAGAIKGSDLCANIIIPSLLPIMIGSLPFLSLAAMIPSLVRISRDIVPSIFS